MTTRDTAMGAVQAALYELLSSDATLTTTLGCAVYDDVPDSAAMPYVSIGEATEIPWNRFQGTGSELTWTIHAWSRYPGRKEALAILARLNQLLDQIPLTLSGGLVNLFCRYEMGNVIRDHDGVTRHLVARYRLLVEAV